MLSRFPIRVRVTLGFVGAMALLLAIGSLVLHALLRRGLDGEIDRALAARSADVRALVAQVPAGVFDEPGSVVTERGESIAQILDGHGTVIDATPGLRTQSLLTGAEERAAATGEVVIGRRDLPGDGDIEARLLAAPITVGSRQMVGVVGAPLNARDDTLNRLTVLLAVGGPIALLVAALSGYWLATAALHPVEAMRRRADEISGSTPGARLPLAPSDDEVRRLGATLNAMLERIDAALARERAFVSDASHELRTPLAILKGELELANRPNRTEQELREAIESAAEETDRLVRLAEDLLVIARFDKDGLPVRRGAVRVRPLMEAVRDRFATRAIDTNREIGVDAPSALEVDGDAARLEQALGNLVDNALRHGAGPITLRARDAGEVVELHVSDAGPGFPDDFVATAFERFTRADSARGRGGTGLGLSIVDAIARAHGGRARLAGPGEGADVWIEIPRPVDVMGA